MTRIGALPPARQATVGFPKRGGRQKRKEKSVVPKAGLRLSQNKPQP